jgi:hypothetical protein
MTFHLPTFPSDCYIVRAIRPPPTDARNYAALPIFHSEKWMRQLTYVRPDVLEWWDVPAPRIQNDGDAIVQPLAVTRCDLDLYIANGTAKSEGPLSSGDGLNRSG